MQNYIKIPAGQCPGTEFFDGSWLWARISARGLGRAGKLLLSFSAFTAFAAFAPVPVLEDAGLALVPPEQAANVFLVGQ